LPLLFVSLSLSLSLSLPFSPLALGSSFSIPRIGRLVLTRLIQMNPRIVRCISRGTDWILKIKKRWSKEKGRGRPTETSERPRFTGLRGLLFLFCAPIRPRSPLMLASSSYPLMLVSLASSPFPARIGVIPIPRRLYDESDQPTIR
jgi:hypothetical protein